MSKLRIYDLKIRDFNSKEFNDVLRLQILTYNLQEQGTDAAFITVERTPEALEADAAAKKLLETEGEKAFPCIVYNDEILWKGSFPSDAALLHHMHTKIEYIKDPASTIELTCESCGKCGGKS